MKSGNQNTDDTQQYDCVRRTDLASDRESTIKSPMIHNEETEI